ncbi:hypothetical protein Hanom_Chr12g01125251 [Helianthus anomalus]
MHMKTIIAYVVKKPPPRKIQVAPLLKITYTFQMKILESWTQHMDMSIKNVTHDEEMTL